MSISSTFHRTVICFATLTALGILVHDTKFDQAVALALPVAAIVGISAHVLDSSDGAHTHVERASLKNAFATGTPRIQPRDEHRRYLQKIFSRTTDPLSGSNVIWPSA